MFNSSIKLTLILYKWNPGPLNLLIIHIKTCFSSPEVTAFFTFRLVFSQIENGKKAQNKTEYLSTSLNS